ncbi:aminodeoxychorismate lyase [Lacimicrobium sp. SS2-24]|uniref:aminodeoxychorismate lyase n=1 Tax=Lacimicrobium sp. SS2-24 TaxID=2005569 RepID=UPI000B4BBD53|nr:aminodeoxychorismate lyase [Lacimicrobium sp. SS2-24]
MTKVLVNGQCQDHLPVADRAVQYGDGVFTTIKVENGKPQLAARHYTRLKHGLLQLNISYPDFAALETEVDSLADDIGQGVLKVLISRGQGGRGYQAPSSPKPLRILSVHDIPEHYAQWQDAGIRLGLSQHTLACQPQLAGIKHLNRLEQVLVKQETTEPEVDDVLVCDTQGMMVECSASNLFWQSNGIWYTPDLSEAGVDGVMRQHLLARFRDKGIMVNQVAAPPCVLKCAQAVFICNSLMGMVPVTRFQSTAYDIKKVKQLSREML